MAIAPIHTDRAGGAPGTVMLVDDEPMLLRSLRRTLEGEGYLTLPAESADAALSWLAEHDPDVVLLDLGLGRDSGLALLERVKREWPEVEVIVITGNASIESAVGCIRGGAFDYLAKPFDDHRVRTTVRRAVEHRKLVRRNRELEAELRERGAGSELIGGSPRMRALRSAIASLGHNESHVLIRGESGTGKELVARALHAASPRAGRRFVPIDCGALPESIIESELFGHVKGAFTGATGAPGLFRIAGGGTLFLD
jgi:DNA-binding NtrC family response regulator